MIGGVRPREGDVLEILAHPGHGHSSGLLLIALLVVGAVLVVTLVIAAVRDSRRSRRRPER